MFRRLHFGFGFQPPWGAAGLHAVRAPVEIVYYRGSKPERSDRILTGTPGWDDHLFVTESPENAVWYGPRIERLRFAGGTRVLRQGTPEYRRVVGRDLGRRGYFTPEMGAVILRAAKAAGYDLVHFEAQTTIGTVVLSPEKIVSRIVISTTGNSAGLTGLHGDVVRGPASWWQSEAVPAPPAAASPAVPSGSVLPREEAARLAKSILSIVGQEAQYNYPNGPYNVGRLQLAMDRRSGADGRMLLALVQAMVAKGMLQNVSTGALYEFILPGTQVLHRGKPVSAPTMDPNTVMRNLPAHLIAAGTRVDIEGIPYRVLTEIDTQAHAGTKHLRRAWLIRGPGAGLTRLDLEKGGGHRTIGQTGVGMAGPSVVWRTDDVEHGFRGQVYDDAAFFVGERQIPGKDFMFVYEVKGNVTPTRLGAIFPTGWTVLQPGGAVATCAPSADCVTVAASTQWPNEKRGSAWQRIGMIAMRDVRTRQVEGYGRTRPGPAMPPGSVDRFTAGAVVRFYDGRRRYVVVCRDPNIPDYYNLVALTGGMRGSAPTGTPGVNLVLDENQTVAFTGHFAPKLQQRYGSMKAHCQYFAKQ